ncbi:MAG: FAD-binding protein [Ruminococcaceae bacterium]|nr:FAD-binding protein [Oscillospiraceae bacterium]
MKYDLIVVGAGPAGMTAALYGARASKSVLVLEGEFPGGQILTSEKIENYPALPATDGYTFAENLKSQILSLGVTLESALVDRVEKREDGFAVFSGETEYRGRSVILATGLRHRHLGVPGEDALIGKGISFCATCDGMFFKNKRVAVVGGGNTAVQDALVLSELCEHVYLIHRRLELRAERELCERVFEKENVEFLGECVVSEIRGEGRVEALILEDLGTHEKKEVFVAGLFEAVGQIPQNEAFRDTVALDEFGYFVTDGSCATSCRGIFAAGDACSKSVRQLTTAVADGTVAALSAVAYIDEITRKRDAK